MTQLDERLRQAGVDDPGARHRAEPSLEQLEAERERLNARIREAEERAKRARAEISAEERARRERAAQRHREWQKRAARVIAFYSDVGVRGSLAGRSTAGLRGAASAGAG
jgi:septal ring factor EnvC (AmiA/AmiB activator)